MPFEPAGWLLLGLIVKAVQKRQEDISDARAWQREQEKRWRRAGKLSSRLSFPSGTQEKMWLASGSIPSPRCAYEHLGGCSGPLQIDHKRALARGGTNRFRNLQYVCEHHNKSKGKKSERQFTAKVEAAKRKRTKQRLDAVRDFLIGSRTSRNRRSTKTTQRKRNTVLGLG